MKLTYLGTSAAEGTPAPFCDCEVCEYARKNGGRNVRTRSQALIDGRLLIDFPGDTYMHVLSEGLRLSQTDGCILTHTHHDHFFPEDLFSRTKVAAHMKEEKPFHFFAEPNTVAAMAKLESPKQCIEQGVLILHEVRPFERFEFSGYTITPLNAFHCKNALIYLIEKDCKTMLYANDTGYFPEDTWNYLRSNGVKLDLVSYDCTYGTWHRGRLGHMDYYENIETRDRLSAEGLLKDGCLHVLTHFSHNNGNHSYDSFAPIAEQDQFIVAYDGLDVKF
jgi:phosphoribosyl 1,2-cyclic phosphate phosphodiesterase